MKYQIIYADPPWYTRYIKENKKGIKEYELPYDTMSDEEILKLPIKDIVDDDAILFLWCIDSKIPIMPKVMSAWGFEYRSVAFVWHKKAITTNGENAIMSWYTSKSCELCFVGARGTTLISDSTQKQFVDEPKREHSRKPDCIRTRIIKACGDRPRIELFARQHFEGWDVWGNEVPTTTQQLISKI